MTVVGSRSARQVGQEQARLDGWRALTPTPAPGLFDSPRRWSAAQGQPATDLLRLFGRSQRTGALLIRRDSEGCRSPPVRIPQDKKKVAEAPSSQLLPTRDGHLSSTNPLIESVSQSRVLGCLRSTTKPSRRSILQGERLDERIIPIRWHPHRSAAPPAAWSGRPVGKCPVEVIDDADWRNRLAKNSQQKPTT